MYKSISCQRADTQRELQGTELYSEKTPCLSDQTTWPNKVAIKPFCPATAHLDKRKRKTTGWLSLCCSAVSHLFVRSFYKTRRQHFQVCCVTSDSDIKIERDKRTRTNGVWVNVSWGSEQEVSRKSWFQLLPARRKWRGGRSLRRTTADCSLMFPRCPVALRPHVWTRRWRVMDESEIDEYQ